MCRSIPLVLALLSFAGCASAPELDRGRELAAAGRIEDALEVLEQGSRRAPDDQALRVALVRQRQLVREQWLTAARSAAQSGRHDQAQALYERVLRLEPHDRMAQAGRDALRAAQEAAELVRQAEESVSQGRLPQAEAALQAALAKDPGNASARRALARLRERQMTADLAPPSLKGALNTPITLELRDTPLRNAFEVLSRTAQLNFVFDRDVKPDARVTLTVRNSPVNDVIRLLLLTQQLERKVLNENSLLIYPATPPKLREYQDLTARFFFLTNIDAKQAQTLLRALGKTREVHIDEKLNMVAVRDTPDAVRLAERLIESIDVAEPEVMLEVEVLEVSRSRALDLGVQFPSEVVAESLLPQSVRVPGGRIDLRDASLTATIANPAMRLGLQSQDTNVNLLANPRIRAKNHEKAKVLIGEKLPVFTTTAVQNAGVASSVSYLDVGLKLEVEPTVFLDDEVGIKVTLEVNSNLERIQSPDGSTAFRLGTRSVQTQLRLRDGETQVLAGLINDNDRETFSKLPGLGDLPGIGRAFGNTVRSRDKSEIVLLITPRVLRNIAPPDASRLMFDAGTELAAGAPPLRIAPTAARGLSLSAAGGSRPVAPAAASPATPAPPPTQAAVQEAEQPLVAHLRVPAEASIGREFTVSVDVPGAGDAPQGEVVVEIDSSLISGGNGGRVVVRLARGAEPGVLSGSINLRAVAAGTGTTGLQVNGGTVRLPSGQERPVAGGAGASLRIGL